MHDGSGDHILSWVGNGASVGAIVSTLAGWLPPAAAFIALIWYVIQIYESNTVQAWVRNKRTRKIARMKARVLMMEAQNKPALPGFDD